jgi:hypothetical protein
MPYIENSDGVLASRSDLIGLNPANNQLINVAGYTPPVNITYKAAPAIITTDNKWKAYVAVLGHNGRSAYSRFEFVSNNTGIENDFFLLSGQSINHNQEGRVPPYDGFTLIYDFNDWGSIIRTKFDPQDGTYDTDFNIGCISHGNYFDMPNAPNLSLTQSIEYGGTKEFTTYNGSSMSNTMWSKQPNWGSLGAWELGTNDLNNFQMYDQKLARSGRRSWSLKFSYIDDSVLWGSNQMLSDYLEVGTTGYDVGDTFDNLSTYAITNGTFDSNVTDGWAIGGPEGTGSMNATYNSGKCDITNQNVTTDQFYNAVGVLADGVRYRVKAEISNYVSASAKVVLRMDNVRSTFGGSSTDLIIDEIDGNKTIEGDFYGTGYDVQLKFICITSGDSQNYSIDNVSIQVINSTQFHPNLLTDVNFFSQVWSQTLGGTLSFIFQPNKDDNTNFAICKFKDNSLKATQTAPNVYDISLKIEEAW